MFGRNRKLAGLTLAVLWTAGCAHSDFRVRSPYQSGRSAGTDAAMADAQLAESPSILPQTHFAAAKLFESQGMPNKAITQYRKAIAVNHSYVEAHERLGLLLSRIGRHEEASRTLRGAVALRPKNAKLRNNLGFELLLLGDSRGAEEAFQEAVRLDPGFARAHVNLGIARSRLGRFDEALESFLTVLPEPDAYYNLALMYRGEGKAGAAVEALRHVLIIDPAFAAARQQLDQLASQSAINPGAGTLTQAGPAPTPPPAVAPVDAVAVHAPANPVKEVGGSGTNVAAAGESKPSIALAIHASERLDEPAVPSPSAPGPAINEDASRSDSRIGTPAMVAPIHASAEPFVPRTDPVRLDDGSGTTDGLDWTVGEANFTPKNPWDDAGVVLAKAVKPPTPVAGAVAGCPPDADDAKTVPVAAVAAELTREPEIAKMLERRVEASGFQTGRPDVADWIEVLQNEIRCLPAGTVETVVTSEDRAGDAPEGAASVLDVSEPAPLALSAWSQAPGSVDDVLPVSVADAAVSPTQLVEVVPEVPCDEPLMIEYVPACDPIGIMGEFAAALDPEEPIIYVEEPVGPIAFSLAVASQLPDASEFEIPANICPVPTDTAAAEVVVTAAPTLDAEPIASVNQAAVIRYLEEQLGLVRAEIECLEEQEWERAASQTPAAVSRGAVRLVAEHESVPDPDTEVDAPKQREEGSAAASATPPLKATGRAPIVKPKPKKSGQLTPKAREVRKRQVFQHHRQPNE